MNDEETTLISIIGDVHHSHCYTAHFPAESIKHSKRFLLYFPPAMMQDIGIMANVQQQKNANSNLFSLCLGVYTH